MQPEVKYLFLDTETTGTDPKKNGIVQLSAIAVFERDGVFVERGRFDSFVQPIEGDELEPSALEVNRLSREQLFAFPEAKKVHAEFLAWMGGMVSKFDRKDKFVMAGYNVRFDEQFVREWFGKLHDKYFGSWFWWPSLDVSNFAAHVLRYRRPDLENFKLVTVAKALGIEVVGDLHNAMVDIQTTLDIYKLYEVRYGREGRDLSDNPPSDGEGGGDRKEPKEPTTELQLSGD